MPLPNTINDISTTASLNYPKGNNNVSLTDDYLRQIQAILKTVYDAQATTNTSIASDIDALESVVALLDSRSLPYAETTGTSSAYLANLGTSVVSVDEGKAYVIKFHATCSANATLQVNGLAPVLDIKVARSDGTLAPVNAGDIVANDILLGITDEAGTSFVVFPKRERVNVTYLSTATTLTVENALDINFVLTATATHTLPLLSTFIEGGSFNVTANATATIQRQGSDVISLNGADVNSITLIAGETVYFVKSAGKWLSVLTKSSIFTKSYNSGEQTITTGGTLTLTHGLGEVPKQVKLNYVCKTAQLNYSVNDKPEAYYWSSNSTGVYVTDVNATTITLVYGSGGGVSLPNKTTGAFAAATNANWRVEVNAFA